MIGKGAYIHTDKPLLAKKVVSLSSSVLKKMGLRLLGYIQCKTVAVEKT